ALERLTRYNAADVAFRIAADTHNSKDANAVGVVAQVKGKGSYLIGYLPKELASDISPLMRAGIGVKSVGTVTGGYYPFMNYGARITLNFA
ncbi:MAG: HIRAN domain-containing protein, partial [Muribaculaceae bacterium]|nr:HIRAN domain-containing protein [Muribaculaceae bacterium]